MSERRHTSEPAGHLDQALARMTWSVDEREFALIGFREPPSEADLACLARPPCQLVREEDETTLLVGAGDAASVVARHPSAKVERDLAWIRFDAPMGWEVVGFLARVTTALAHAGVPLGVVCGFSRDHLFVRRRYMAAARGVLEDLFPERRQRRS